MELSLSFQKKLGLSKQISNYVMVTGDLLWWKEANFMLLDELRCGCPFSQFGLSYPSIHVGHAISFKIKSAFVFMRIH